MGESINVALQFIIGEIDLSKPPTLQRSELNNSTVYGALTLQDTLSKAGYFLLVLCNSTNICVIYVVLFPWHLELTTVPFVRLMTKRRNKIKRKEIT